MVAVLVVHFQDGQHVAEQTSQAHNPNHSMHLFSQYRFSQYRREYFTRTQLRRKSPYCLTESRLPYRCVRP